jgi:hypothetical protein
MGISHLYWILTGPSFPVHQSAVLLSHTRPLPVISGVPHASTTDLPRALFENIQSDKFGPAGSKACSHHYIVNLFRLVTHFN